METIQHSGSLGARVGEKSVSFRVWAPKAHQIEVVFDNGKAEPLDRDSTGYYYGISAHARVGTTYRYRLDGQQAFPDPCSRFQPQGPHGPSQIVDSSSYTWSDQTWPGVQMAGHVIYELHVGAFTKEGTFDAAIEQLDFLKRLGITLLELMPIAEFSGRWNWDCDGVFLFAPSHRYGNHEAFKRFVDAAHQKSLGIPLNGGEQSILMVPDPMECGNSLCRMPVTGLKSFM